MVPDACRLQEHPAGASVRHHHQPGGHECVDDVVNGSARKPRTACSDRSQHFVRRPMTRDAVQDIQNPQARLCHTQTRLPQSLHELGFPMLRKFVGHRPLTSLDTVQDTAPASGCQGGSRLRVGRGSACPTGTAPWLTRAMGPSSTARAIRVMLQTEDETPLQEASAGCSAGTLLVRGRASPALTGNGTSAYTLWCCRGGRDVPRWRNRQTRYLEGVVPERAWGFKSLPRHPFAGD